MYVYTYIYTLYVHTRRPLLCEWAAPAAGAAVPHPAYTPVIYLYLYLSLSIYTYISICIMYIYIYIYI